MSGTKVAALSVLLLLPAALSSAQASVAQKPLPPIVRKFIAAVHHARTLSVEVTQTAHFGPFFSGTFSGASLSLEKPNKLALTSSFSGVRVTTAASDGLTLSDWDGSDYTQQPAPKNLEGMLLLSHRGLLLDHMDAIASNIAFVLFTHPDALAALPNLEDAGQDNVEGATAQKVTAFLPETSYDVSPATLEKATFWFSATTCLPLQAEIMLRGSTATLRFAHYGVDKPILETAFAAHPPAGLTWRHPSPVMVEPDAPAPNFTLRTMDDKPLTLSALKGRVILLAFWATYLPTGFLDEAIRAIGDVQASKRGQGLTVLWIAETDRRDLVSAYLKAHAQTPMTVLLDSAPGPESVGRKLYRLPSLPTYYVISRTGKVSASFLGFGPDKQETVQAESRDAAIAILVHGGIPPDISRRISSFMDNMDAPSLDAALTAAGLTGPQR